MFSENAGNEFTWLYEDGYDERLKANPTPTLFLM
jgi:hypothetical protein